MIDRSFRAITAFRAPTAALFILAALTGASTSQAEEALVLSGGGARGLAHAGVVLGMEQRGHDPGVIVGTSMGAIVGALYAAGYDGPAIRSILESEDWRRIFTPFPFEVGPSRALRYPALRLDTSTGAAFGSRAAIPDWRINRRLVQLLFEPSARGRGDFDRLPRRFRSMTADAEDGTLVAIGSGDLARAVRASMAAAGFFAPVRWRGGEANGRLLTDGGIADYLPVAEARRLGGGPVIASDVLQPPRRLQSTDAIAVARRSTELLTVHARREPVAPDVLLVPDLDPGMAEFSYPVDPVPAIEAGLRTALASLPPASLTEPDRAGSGRRAPPPEPSSLSGLTVEDAALSGARDPRFIPFLERAFRPAAPSRYHSDRILEIVDRLYATGLFDGVWPSVESASPEDTSLTTPPVLRIRAEPRPLVSVSGAVGYDNDKSARIWASLRRLDAVGAHPLEVSLEGAANGVEQWGAASMRFTTLAPGSAAAWTLGAHFTETETRFIEVPGSIGDLEVTRAGGWASFEARSLEPERHAAAALRAEHVESDFGPDGDSFGASIRIESVAPLVEVVGANPHVEAEARFGDVEYRRAHARGSIRSSLGPFAVAAVADAAVVGGDAPLDVAPSMGGEGLVPGLREGERRGRARSVLGADVAVQAPMGATLRVRGRGGIIADESRPEHGLLYSREKLWLGGVRISALWWTVFGPIEVGGEASTLGDRRVLVRLGPEF